MICPKCNKSISFWQYISCSRQHPAIKGNDFVNSCPHCQQEYFIHGKSFLGSIMITVFMISTISAGLILFLRKTVVMTQGMENVSMVGVILVGSFIWWTYLVKAS